MWSTLRRALPTLALVVVAIVSAALLHYVQDEGEGAKGKKRQDPDFYLEGFTQVTMDISGEKKHRLSGKQLIHYPDTDTHELVNPYLQLFRREQPPWHIEAETGWVSETGEVVLLRGRVHAWRDDPNGDRELDMRTRDLRILTESDFAETDQPVVIRNRHGESRGVGMRAYLGEERIELLARVRTIHRREEQPIALPTQDP